MECDAETNAMRCNEVKIEKTRKKVREHSVKSTAASQFKKKRVDKAREIMTRRNHELTFVSRKRKIFNALKHIGRQERAFCLCVNTVLSKSLWNKGF